MTPSAAAKPSMPSSRFRAFIAPTSQNSETGTASGPRSSTSPNRLIFLIKTPQINQQGRGDDLPGEFLAPPNAEPIVDQAENDDPRAGCEGAAEVPPLLIQL